MKHSAYWLALKSLECSSMRCLKLNSKVHDNIPSICDQFYFGGSGWSSAAGTYCLSFPAATASVVTSTVTSVAGFSCFSSVLVSLCFFSSFPSFFYFFSSAPSFFSFFSFFGFSATGFASFFSAPSVCSGSLTYGKNQAPAYGCSTFGTRTPSSVWQF